MTIYPAISRPVIDKANAEFQHNQKGFYALIPRSDRWEGERRRSTTFGQHGDPNCRVSAIDENM
jgi:hypothetical protein